MPQLLRRIPSRCRVSGSRCAAPRAVGVDGMVDSRICTVHSPHLLVGEGIVQVPVGVRVGHLGDVPEGHARGLWKQRGVGHREVVRQAGATSHQGGTKPNVRELRPGDAVAGL